MQSPTYKLGMLFQDFERLRAEEGFLKWIFLFSTFCITPRAVFPVVVFVDIQYQVARNEEPIAAVI